MTPRPDNATRWVRGAGVAALWWAGVVVIAFVQLRAMSLSIEVYDEGLALYGGWRVAQGALPYRDFWSMYSPGNFYALGLLDRLFGETVFVERCFDAACRAAIAMLVYALVRRRGGRGSALAATMAVCGLLIGGPALSSTTLPGTACALWAMRWLGRAIDGEPIGHGGSAWLGTGVAAGLTALFRQDLGAYLVVVCLGALALQARQAEPSAIPARRSWADLAGFVAGVAVVTLPVATALWIAVPLHDLYDSLVRIPTQVYPANRSLPFPMPSDVIERMRTEGNLRALLNLGVYLPPLVAAAAVGVLMRARRVLRRTANPNRTTTGHAPTDIEFGAWIALDLLFCMKGAVRTEFVHMLPAIIVSVVLATLTMRRVRWPIVRTLLAVLVVGGAAARIEVLVSRSERMNAAMLPASPLAFAGALAGGCGNPHGVPLGCFKLDEGSTAVLDYLLAHGAAGAPIYVGTGRHDKLLMNNVELYFLSGRPAVTKWHDLHPGVQTTRAIQADIIQTMEAHPPAFVVRNSQFDSSDEPNRSRESSGVHLLDDYLASRFEPVLTESTFTLSVPRPKPAGQAP